MKKMPHLRVSGKDVSDGLAGGLLRGRDVAENGRNVLVADDAAHLVDVVAANLLLDKATK
jgi:hypothetical protein